MSEPSDFKIPTQAEKDAARAKLAEVAKRTAAMKAQKSKILRETARDLFPGPDAEFEAVWPQIQILITIERMRQHGL